MNTSIFHFTPSRPFFYDSFLGVLFLAGFILIPVLACAQGIDDNQSCMDCHGETDLMGEIDGQEMSMFVDAEKYQNSIHADFACIDCHQDIEESPHALELERVDCGMCHFESAQDLAESAHQIEDGPNCISCHGEAHAILLSDNANSPTHRRRVIELCSRCHDGEAQADSLQTSPNITDASASYMASVHGKAWLAGDTSAANCVDCHGAHKVLAAENPTSPVHHNNTPQTCGQCHEEAQNAFQNSIHAVSLRDGSTDAASCTNCHGEHDIKETDGASARTARTHIYDMCGQCHFDVTLMKPYGINSANLETLIKGSVHAQELFAGNEEAPTCVDCHNHHEILALRHPNSPISSTNVASTCGQCHATIENQYNESIHGQSAQRGHREAPVCTDCHGEHAIVRTDDERSPVSHFNVASNTCGRCHDSLVINNKYAISSTKVASYFDSYHGLALQHGSKTVADCASCHGTHLILPASDPRSTVSAERLVETCGTCHPGISENVLATPIHSDSRFRSDSILVWVPRIYIFLIVVVIGIMLAHNTVIFWALLKERFRRIEEAPKYSRFNRFEIWMHLLLALSFILLAITGFALVYPNAWWVQVLSALAMDEAMRSLLHRIAGVVMIAISLLYTYYSLASPRGREEVWAFMPNRDDFKHPKQYLAYNLGKQKEPPQFDRYDYTEKLEFWALVWGVIIMAVTGLMLWFPVWVLEYLPIWAIDIAELVHFYEAVLATLAILIWHFFFVIFHPKQYPMNTTWLTGHMSLEHLKQHHPKEYERVMKTPQLYNQLVKNAPAANPPQDENNA